MPCHAHAMGEMAWWPLPSGLGCRCTFCGGGGGGGGGGVGAGRKSDFFTYRMNAGGCASQAPHPPRARPRLTLRAAVPRDATRSASLLPMRRTGQLPAAPLTGGVRQSRAGSPRQLATPPAAASGWNGAPPWALAAAPCSADTLQRGAALTHAGAPTTRGGMAAGSPPPPPPRLPPPPLAVRGAGGGGSRPSWCLLPHPPGLSRTAAIPTPLCLQTPSKKKSTTLILRPALPLPPRAHAHFVPQPRR